MPGRARHLSPRGGIDLRILSLFDTDISLIRDRFVQDGADTDVGGVGDRSA